MIILSYVWTLISALHMEKNKLLVLIFLLFTCSLHAQKPALDQNVYDGWKSLASPLVSDDGAWVTYTINPQQGDGWFFIFNVSARQKDSVERAGHAVFSPGNKYVAYQVIPSYAETRQAKKNKLKEDKMPKNDLEIRLLSSDVKIRVARVKSFAVSEKKSDWIAYLLEKKNEEKKEKSISTDTVAVKSGNKHKKTKSPEPKGTEFVILNPLSKKEFRYQDVTEYAVAANGKTISFIQAIADTTKIDNFIISVFDTNTELTGIIFEGKGSAKKLSTDKSGNLVSFIYSSDTSKVKIHDLYLSKNLEKSVRIVDTANISMPHKWSVSENGNITYSDDGTRLFFGTAQKPVKEPKDTLLDEEKYKLDIWSWDDDLLQPMQKKQLDQERKRNWQAVYIIGKNRMVQLADTNIPSVRTTQKGDGLLALGTSDLKYRKSSSWDGGGFSDSYIINIETGVKTQVLTKSSSAVSLSPACKYLVYWDNDAKAWFSASLTGDSKKNLTSSIKVPLCDELNDIPDDPSPHGIAGWSDDQKHLLVYDRYDIWSVDLNGSEAPVNITGGFGRSNNLRFRYLKLDPDAEFINRKDPVYLSSFNYENKEAGFYKLEPGMTPTPVKLLSEKASFPGELIKAKKAGVFIWQKGSFSDSPELYISNLDFGDVRKISITNPQQSKYNWGTAELVEWMSFDRQELQGILYKPENFDSSRKYPMIVYFYERSSDGLYNYMPPAPSASIINRIFAASNGYLVFVPDIPYVTGYPGQSCYNSVMSGTYSLIDRFPFIDKDRIGLDGQSWGGYQIAWLVTQTNLFACAYAGAAVSDMVSAYGGIRWGTGMSRMFQYEKTQSRIGGTLWEKPVQFIENSPVFFVPKINTPLLLMHNDADDAVPWYQSIEFITALRRLGKPAWLLSYNDEAHNLVKRPNRKDISIRKMQFFDHYLKDAPMPSWMKYGISQVQKGKNDGYQLINE
jgi:dipeptidyl aminopeptidase/acylaminoacyl peptidase